MKVLQLIFILIFSNLMLKAQQEFSLQQCIETALKNNIRLKQSQLNLQSSGIDVLNSKAALLPTLNGSFSETTQYGRNIDPITNAFEQITLQSGNLGLNSSVTLFNGFQLLNSVKLNKLNYSANSNDLLALQNDLALQVAAAYLQVMYAEDNLTNAKSQLDVTVSQRNRTEILVKAGKLAENSLLEQDAQKANDEYNLQMAENGIISAKLTLLQLMELPSTTTYKIQRPNISLPVNEKYDVNVIYEESVSKRPEVKSAEIRKQGALINEKIAKGGLSPRISLSAGMSTLYRPGLVAKVTTLESYSIVGETLIGYTHPTYDSVFTTKIKYNYKTVTTPIKLKDQVKNNFGQFVGLGVTVPIFNNLRVYSNIKKTHLNTLNQDLNLAQTKNTLLKNIQSAVTDVEAAKAKYEAALKSLQAQSTNFNNMEIRYNQGLTSFLDYATAKNNKARAEVNLQQAKYDLIMKSKIIDFYKGISITL